MKDKCSFEPLKRHRSDKLEAFVLEWDSIHDCLYVGSRKLTCYQLMINDGVVELEKRNTMTETQNDSKDWIATLSSKTEKDNSCLVMCRSEDHMFRVKQPYITLVCNSFKHNKQEWKREIPLVDTQLPFEGWPVADCQLVRSSSKTATFVTCFQKSATNLKVSPPYFVLHSLVF